MSMPSTGRTYRVLVEGGWGRSSPTEFARFESTIQALEYAKKLVSDCLEGHTNPSMDAQTLLQSYERTGLKPTIESDGPPIPFDPLGYASLLCEEICAGNRITEDSRMRVKEILAGIPEKHAKEVRWMREAGRENGILTEDQIDAGIAHWYEQNRASFEAMEKVEILVEESFGGDTEARLSAPASPATRHEKIAAQTEAIEGAMKRLGVWQEDDLEPPQADYRLAFAEDTMTLLQWLQFVLIPMVWHTLATDGSFPGDSQIGEKAIREFDGQDDLSELVSLLCAFDALFDG